MGVLTLQAMKPRTAQARPAVLSTSSSYSQCCGPGKGGQ
jgi:hypothetical protein